MGKAKKGEGEQEQEQKKVGVAHSVALSAGEAANGAFGGGFKVGAAGAQSAAPAFGAGFGAALSARAAARGGGQFNFGTSAFGAGVGAAARGGSDITGSIESATMPTGVLCNSLSPQGVWYCLDWREGVPNSCKLADRCKFAHSGGSRQNNPPAKCGGFGGGFTCGTAGAQSAAPAFGAGFGAAASAPAAGEGEGGFTFGAAGAQSAACSWRAERSASPAFTFGVSPSAPKDGEIVGIGIGLSLDSEHNLCISSLLPDSPALRSGLLQEGDFLRFVDGIDVCGMTPEGVRPKILGKTGTFVTVSVQRGNNRIVARLPRARPLSVAAPSLFLDPKAGSKEG